MTGDAEARDLFEDEAAKLVEAAADDEREGRLVHCANERELREFLSGLQHEHV